MTEQTFSIPCCNCNKLMVAGDESISLTIARECLGDGFTQPVHAHSVFDLCTDCAPLSLYEKFKEISIPIGVFNDVVFNRPSWRSKIKLDDGND